ncbi:MAG: hypothetical protein WC663_00430 [Patescibacteria group bacterium]|jgi:hypothetical protein
MRQSALIIFLSLILSSNAIAQVYPCNLQEAKIALQDAVDSNIRTDIDCSFEELAEVSDPVEKIEFLRLWVLGIDGSYTDAILTGLMEINWQYTALAINYDGEMIDLARSQIMLLLQVLIVLDHQIGLYIAHEGARNLDHDKYLIENKDPECKKRKFDEVLSELTKDGFKPTKKHVENQIDYQCFIEQYPEYKRMIGFYSSAIYDRIGHGRSLTKFHSPEIIVLSEFYLALDMMDELSDEDFFEVSAEIQLLF